MLSETEIRAFLTDHKVHAFDPDTGAHAATIEYRSDGVALAAFADGRTERGVWGLEGAAYWTRYEAFRGGETHYFHLKWVGPETAQAYHADQSRAFLQSHHDKVPT